MEQERESLLRALDEACFCAETEEPKCTACQAKDQLLAAWDQIALDRAVPTVFGALHIREATRAATISEVRQTAQKMLRNNTGWSVERLRDQFLAALDEMEGSASQSANEPDLVGASESATHEASPRCSREDEPEWCETGPAGENPQGAALPNELEK